MIGGEKKMVVWNDLVADEKMRVYDRGVKTTTQEGVYKLLVNYRSGDMLAPRLEQVEALQQEMKLFCGLHYERGTRRSTMAAPACAW